MINSRLKACIALPAQPTKKRDFSDKECIGRTGDVDACHAPRYAVQLHSAVVCDHAVTAVILVHDLGGGTVVARCMCRQLVSTAVPQSVSSYHFTVGGYTNRYCLSIRHIVNLAVVLIAKAIDHDHR